MPDSSSCWVAVSISQVSMWTPRLSPDRLVSLGAGPPGASRPKSGTVFLETRNFHRKKFPGAGRGTVSSAVWFWQDRPCPAPPGASRCTETGGPESKTPGRGRGFCSKQTPRDTHDQEWLPHRTLFICGLTTSWKPSSWTIPPPMPGTLKNPGSPRCALPGLCFFPPKYSIFENLSYPLCPCKRSGQPALLHPQPVEEGNHGSSL